MHEDDCRYYFVSPLHLLSDRKAAERTLRGFGRILAKCLADDRKLPQSLLAPIFFDLLSGFHFALHVINIY